MLFSGRKAGQTTAISLIWVHKSTKSHFLRVQRLDSAQTARYTIHQLTKLKPQRPLYSTELGHGLIETLYHVTQTTMTYTKNLALQCMSRIHCTYTMQFCPKMVILHQSWLHAKYMPSSDQAQAWQGSLSCAGIEHRQTAFSASKQQQNINNLECMHHCISTLLHVNHDWSKKIW